MLFTIIFFALVLITTAIECPVGTLLLDGKCIQCEPGHYSFTPEHSSRRRCLPCPAGTSQPAFGAVERRLCRACWPGTFAVEKASTECKPCPSGTWSYYGADKCHTCPAGTFILPKGEGCKSCPFGYYSTKPNSLYCTQCPFLTTTYTLNATSPADCKPCVRGPYCRKCSVSDYFQPYEAYNLTKYDSSYFGCRECPSGTYYEGFRAISSASQCRPCPQGKFRVHRKVSSWCSLCKSGQTTASPGGMYCKKESDPCPADTYETADGNCNFCDPGYRFIPEKKTCKKCPPGTVGKGRLSTKCYKCAKNMFPDVYQGRCVCKLGEERKNNRCVPCPVGHYNDWTNNIESCRPCEKGIAPRKGTVRCKNCPFGLVSNKDHTSCTTCPPELMPNIFSDRDYELLGWGVTVGTQCVVPQTGCSISQEYRLSYGRTYICSEKYCTPETVEADFGVKCRVCEKGHYLFENRNGCDACEPDSVSDGGVATECKPCPNGTVAIGEGDKCGCSGYYRVNYGMQGGVCKKCPSGFYSTKKDEFCKRCGSAQIITDSGCKYCWRNQVPNDEKSKCVPCPPGTKVNRGIRADKCV